ncbi:hypothetical protein QQF64_002560 [Cirrhinus molitorella]|uniref:Uncharacterized protein n=1 Tax=Cirrhinus molitorella TaxID=172907 RepID=A0ABR3MQJ0_9TELE
MCSGQTVLSAGQTVAFKPSGSHTPPPLTPDSAPLPRRPLPLPAIDLLSASSAAAPQEKHAGLQNEI